MELAPIVMNILMKGPLGLLLRTGITNQRQKLIQLAQDLNRPIIINIINVKYTHLLVVTYGVKTKSIYI